MLAVDLSNLNQFKPFQPHFDQLQLRPRSALTEEGLSNSIQASDSITKIQQVINHRLSEQMGTPARALPVGYVNKTINAEEIANNVLGMVQSRLKQAESEGADQEQLQSMLEQAKAGVEQGINEAKEVLHGLGQLNDSVDAEIDQVQELVTKGLTPDLEDVQAPTDVHEIEVSHGLSQMAESTFELEVTTRDGDLVTLKFSQLDSQQDVLAYRKTGNTEMLSTSHITNSNSQFELSVDGELDEDELSAIANLTNDIQQLSEEFFDGNTQVAFEQGLQLGYNTEEIAGFALEMQHTQSSIATSKYREISELDSVSRPKLAGLDQVRELLGGIGNLVEKTEEIFDNPNQAASGMLQGAMLQHPKAGEFSEQLHHHADEDLEDVVDKLVEMSDHDHDDDD